MNTKTVSVVDVAFSRLSIASSINFFIQKKDYLFRLFLLRKIKQKNSGVLNKRYFRKRLVYGKS